MIVSRILPGGLAVAALLVTAGSASATGYSDEAQWQAAAGAFDLETFEGYGDFTSLQSLANLNIDFGQLNDGKSFPTVFSTGTTGGVSHSGTQVLVNQSQPVLPGLGPIILLPKPGSFISAAGYWNTGGDDSTEIRFYDANNALIESWN